MYLISCTVDYLDPFVSQIRYINRLETKEVGQVTINTVLTERLKVLILVASLSCYV